MLVLISVAVFVSHHLYPSSGSPVEITEQPASGEIPVCSWVLYSERVGFGSVPRLFHKVLKRWGFRHFSLPLQHRISSCLKPVLSIPSKKSARPQLVRNWWCSGYIAYWKHIPRDNRTKTFHKTYAPQAREYKAKCVTWGTVCPHPKDLALAIFRLLKSGGLGHSLFQRLPDNTLDMRLSSAFHFFLF